MTRGRKAHVEKSIWHLFQILAGTEMGLIIQALKYLGQDSITSIMETSIKPRIAKMDEKILMSAFKVAPAWIRKLLVRMKETL